MEPKEKNRPLERGEYVSKTRINELKRRLRKMNRSGVSLRELSRMYGGKITSASLGRIIGEKEWMPKSLDVLRTLGAIAKRSPYAKLPRYFFRNDDALAYYEHQKDLETLARNKAKEQFKSARYNIKQRVAVES